MDDSLMFSVMVYGPSNTLQQEFQRYSMGNLDTVELYLKHPERAPEPNTHVAGVPVESTDRCALCNRRPNQGEKGLASCKSCYTVKYCNEICQRGHWTEGQDRTRKRRLGHACRRKEESREREEGRKERPQQKQAVGHNLPRELALSGAEIQVSEHCVGLWR